MKIREFIIMPQTIKPMGLVHRPGKGPNNRFDFKNKNNNRANELAEKCWDGYRQQGMKKKGDRMVPNCVRSEDAAGVGLITKQNTTQDVKPGETERNLRKLHLINSIEENFADGRGPGRKGDSKRAGIPRGATIAQLKKIRSSKTASPRKKQLAHWQINMRQGRKK